MHLIVIILVIICHSFSEVVAQPQPLDKSVTAVSVQKLSDLLIKRELSTAAEVLTKNNAEIAAEIIGVIEKINVDVGQQVVAGDVLVTLQDTDYVLALEQLQASLQSINAQIEQATQRLARANNLKKDSHISADELLARQTDLTVLNAQKINTQLLIKRAQRDVQRTQIVAPFDGIVVQRMAQQGSYVNAGTVLVRLVEHHHAEVEADIPMHLGDTIMEADEILFTVGQRDFVVQLKRLSPVIEPGLRSQKARLTFIDKQAPIGASGTLIWRVDQALLPADLMVNRNQQLGVFMASQGQAKFHHIPNAQEGRPVVIDLDAETSIIVGGRERLQNGDAISLK